jgi:NAD/NADP transhydrogenase beta subunit
MALAQAEFKVLAALLEKSGATVKFAIHPVAGRMPGHMSVILAEAEVYYENLLLNRPLPRMDLVARPLQQRNTLHPAGDRSARNPSACRSPDHRRK